MSDQPPSKKDKNHGTGTIRRMIGTIRSGNKSSHKQNPFHPHEEKHSGKKNDLNESELTHVASANTIDVSKLSDDEVRERFKLISGDLIEGDATKKQMFEKITVVHMRGLLDSYYKREAEQWIGEKSPEYQIQALNHLTVDNIAVVGSKKIFDRVAISLKTYGLKWNKVFGENSNGPNAMINGMKACITRIQITREKYNRDGNDRREKQDTLNEILGAGIEAFRNYMNIGWNFNSMKEALAKDIASITIEVLNIISFDSDERSMKIKSSCAILLFALAMPNENNPSNGQNIIELMDQSTKKWCPGRERFDCFIHELSGPIEVASSFLMCINAIFVTLSTEQRYHLRSELFRSGFKTHFEDLQNRVNECEEIKLKDNLSTQIDLFLRSIDRDYQAMNIKLDSITETWGDIRACFEHLYTLVKGRPSEGVLSSIVNRILCIRDDEPIRHSYLRLIDECVTRIVFAKTATDPDFDTYSMDSETNGDTGLNLHDQLAALRSASTNDIPQIVGNTTNHLQATENEIQVNLLKGRLEHLEQTRDKLTRALETIITKVDAETATGFKRQYSEIFGEITIPASPQPPSGNVPPPPPPPPLPPSMGGSMPPPPPPPLPPSMGGFVPPPPSFDNLMPPPPPPDGSTGNIPPPPPPPMPGLGPPPPPPPPFPDMNGSGGAPPPPPPPPGGLPPGFGAPPPPPGGLPPGFGAPPPPPGGLPPGFGAPAFQLGPPPLPDYLPVKQKYVVGEPVKKVNLSKITPHNIKKDSIWVSLDEKNCQNKALFATLKENFATKAAPSKNTGGNNDTESSSAAPSIGNKPTPVFRVLDPRAGQNFAIMFSQLKSNPQQFRQWLLACDSERLTNDLLGQLNKSLPTPEDLKKLADLKNEFDTLPDSEQYFCAISDIKRIHQRISLLLFKSQYKEQLESAEKALVAGRQACETVRRSKRFPKLFELVLTICNFMSSSTKTHEPIYGFDISSLPKLHSTKANDGKRTLLHFILQEIEKDHPDLLQFSDEFQGVSEVASKIDINELQRSINEIKTRVNSAQVDLDNAKNAATDGSNEDRFAEVMEGFVKIARDDIERLDSMNTKMTNAFQDLCDYVSMDMKKCPLNEFFAELKSFCTLFSTCLQENRLWREQEEKNKRTQLSKQLVDDIKKKQRAEPKQPEAKPFFKPSDEDTDVVSNLMSVLRDANMGGAQPRRVRRPAPGRSKVSELRRRILDRENAQYPVEDNFTPRLLTTTILKDRNYV